jgi:hypothetical protein
MLSRRAFVGKLAAGAAAAGAVGAIGSRAQAALSEAEAPSAAPAAPARVTDAAAQEASAAPWALVAPLSAGAALHGEWQLAALSGASAGSCVATLRNARGRQERIHLCRNTGQPSGVVHTERFDLVVMNGGDGAQATEEGLAQAVAALAHAVARNESGYADATVLGELLGHEERVARYADSARLR